jgi:hypothetical protein
VRRGIISPPNQPKKIGEKARRAIATVLFLTKTTKQNDEGIIRQTRVKHTVVPIFENTQTLLKKGRGYRVIHKVEGRPPSPQRIQVRAFELQQL